MNVMGNVGTSPMTLKPTNYANHVLKTSLRTPANMSAEQHAGFVEDQYLINGENVHKPIRVQLKLSSVLRKD